MTLTPRSAAQRPTTVPVGDAERFDGYGVMGLPFRSGHYLALRNFSASSIGEGYLSVWHRAPDGVWTFYSSNSPRMSCARYFAGPGDDSHTSDISVDWTGEHELHVRVDDTIDWTVTLSRTPATMLMNAMASVMPKPLWHHESVLALMGRMAGPILRAGKVRLTGEAVSDFTFVTNPRLLWRVTGSRVTVNAEDIGPVGPVSPQAQVGGFYLPQRGMFAVGQAYFTPVGG